MTPIMAAPIPNILSPCPWGSKPHHMPQSTKENLDNDKDGDNYEMLLFCLGNAQIVAPCPTKHTDFFGEF